MENNWHNSIKEGGSTILASDMNSHSHTWNPRCEEQCHVALYDENIDDYEVQISYDNQLIDH
jgi:hypothetical protein